MKTKLAQKMQFKVTPQLVMTSKLLQASITELERIIAHEMNRNPALELSGANKQSPGKGIGRAGNLTAAAGPDDLLENIPASRSALDRLAGRAMLMADRCDIEMVVFLLHSLDEYGYLKASSQELAKEFGASVESIERVVGILHQLEPPGIGARNLQECLLIQSAHLESQGIDCFVSRRLLTETWDEFAGQNWKQAARKLHISEEDVIQAQSFIVKNLYPYPLLLLEDASLREDMVWRADLIINKQVAGNRFKYTVEYPASDLLQLRISKNFKTARVGSSAIAVSSEDQEWIQDHIMRANAFIAAVQQRWVTLQRIGDHIIALQQDYLEFGPLHHKPLTRVAVAEELGLHESTVSRAIRSKIVQLPNGRFILLTDFFDHTLAAKESMRHILASSIGSLSDQEIANRLRSMGLNLARRTITKYRRQMKIPPSHLRQRTSIQQVS